MMWFLPRSDPGATTEYLRPNGCGVSTEGGALLPHGMLPRLLGSTKIWGVKRRDRPPCDLRFGLSTVDVGKLDPTHFGASHLRPPVLRASLSRHVGPPARQTRLQDEPLPLGDSLALAELCQFSRSDPTQLVCHRT